MRRGQANANFPPRQVHSIVQHRLNKISSKALFVPSRNHLLNLVGREAYVSLTSITRREILPKHDCTKYLKKRGIDTR